MIVIPVRVLPCGFRMPVLSYGTWSIGGKRERVVSNDDEADVRAIQMAIELGFTSIDTAERYAGGHAETLVGQAIYSLQREKLFLTSKVHATHFAYDEVLRSCDGILRRLQTSYLDLLLLHSYSPAVPLAITLRAFRRLVDERLVRAVGVSNFLPVHLQEAQDCLGFPIVCNQVHYSLRTREIEHVGGLPDTSSLLVAYRPVENGKLTQSVPDVLQEMCKRYDKTPAQVALNWLLSQPQTNAIVFSRSRTHLLENLGALGWEMTREDIEYLRVHFPDQQTRSSITPLG